MAKNKKNKGYRKKKNKHNLRLWGFAIQGIFTGITREIIGWFKDSL